MIALHLQVPLEKHKKCGESMSLQQGLEMTLLDPVITLMLAVLLFIPPVPSRAISPKQTPGPRVTNTMLSLGPPTT